MKNNRTLLTVAAALLVAAATTGFLIRSKSNSRKNAGSDVAVTENAGAGNNASSQADDATARAAERTKNRRTVANEELVAKYGESRTNLSKHASTNVVGILEDAVQMGEMMTSGQGGGFGRGMGMVLGRLNGELQLTPEQNEKASGIFKEYQRRQIEKQKAAIERLQKDPTPLMKLMLASDASARGELDDEAYKSAQAEAGADLSDVINPLDRKNFGGGSPLRDESFVSDFRGILDPSQSEKLDASIAQRQTEAQTDPTTVPGVAEGNIAGLPKMELEKLDQSIESARKVTTGIKSMMDGMSGLKDVIPPPPGEGGN